MSGPTSRGPRYVRSSLKAHLLDTLPGLVAFLRAEWDQADAFPPAGVEQDSAQIPDRDELIQTAMGRPQDRWPLVQIEVSNSTVRRAAIETIDGSDSLLYFVTYSVQAFVWIDVDIPDSVPLEDEREYATDVRDDLQMALRYALLDTPQVGSGDPLVVLPTTYVEDYGEPQAAQGQRWTVGGRARFSARAQERLSRTSIATVGPGGSFDMEITVGELAPQASHPAL